MKKLLMTLLVFGLSANFGFAQTQTCNPSKRAKIPSIKRLTYHAARKRLLAAGWKPVQTKSAADAASDPDISSGNGRVFWKRGYVEVEACAGTGLAPCAFLFEDAYGNRLRVRTAGEELPKQKSSARVTGFQFVCY